MSMRKEDEVDRQARLPRGGRHRGRLALPLNFSWATRSRNEDPLPSSMADFPINFAHRTVKLKLDVAIRIPPQRL